MIEYPINRQEVARVLERVFSGNGDAYNPQTFAQLAELNCPTLILRMRPELLTQLADEGFDLNGFVLVALKGFRVHYLRALAQMKTSARDERVVDEYNQVVLDLGNLVSAVVPYSYLAETEIEMYLNSDDPYLNSYGASMLDAMPPASVRYAELILGAMARNDSYSGSFGLAPSLARHLDESPEIYERVYARFDIGNDKLQGNIIQTFPEVVSPLPLRAQQLILQTARRSETTNEKLFNFSVISLAVCHALREEAITFLVPHLRSPLWYVRGNAAMSLAKLGIDDAHLIRQIGDLVFDSEGFDWSVCTAALAALSTLGGKASCAIPRLLALAETELDEEDVHGYPCIAALLAETFGAIGDSAPEVVEALRKIVAKQGFISALPATFALGLLGAAAMPALDTIAAYLFGEAQPGDSAASAAELVAVLVAIAGDSHPLVSAFIEQLKLSPFDEVVTFANAYSA